MKAAARARRDRIRAQLADLKMPGALEALDEVLRITSYNVCYTKLLRHEDTDHDDDELAQ